jgi:hypothetical protein
MKAGRQTPAGVPLLALLLLLVLLGQEAEPAGLLPSDLLQAGEVSQPCCWTKDSEQTAVAEWFVHDEQ